MKTVKLNPTQELPVIGVKITEEMYAEQFVHNGVIHFSDPSVWQNPDICNGKQLDDAEGCFCYSTVSKDEEWKKAGRRFNRTGTDGAWKYYEKDKKIVGSCFYGVRRSAFQDMFMQYGIQTIPVKEYVVSYQYFQNFNKSQDNNKNKKTIIIYDMNKLYRLIIKQAIAMGAAREDILIAPVYYVNKQVPFFTNEPFPFEYFLKDSSFSEQEELRVIISSKNKVFYDNLSRNHSNITVGDISSFSILQDKYTEDLHFSIQGNSLIYNFAESIKQSLDQRSFRVLLEELYQIKQNRLPGLPKEQNQLDDLAEPIIKHLKNKYGVEFKDDWRLYNVPYEEYIELPNIYKGMCILKE